MFKILGLVMIFATIFGSCGQNAGSPHSFGKKLKLNKNLPLELGEITITFIDERTETATTIVGVEPVSTSYFDFRIQKDSVDEIMTWTAENGHFRPWRFGIGGQRYELELRKSGQLGPLADDEIVVWKK